MRPRHTPSASHHRLPAAAAAAALLLVVMVSACGAPNASPAARTRAAAIGASTTPGTPVAANDPLLAQQYGLVLTRLDQAWAGSLGDGVVIAIVDTGIDATHPDLAGRLVAGTSLVPGDPSMGDPNGHGTHVAGIAAAATNNGVGIAGGAPGAKLMPVRVLGPDGSGSDGTIAAGIRWAVDHGAGVVNLSLGESGFASRLSKGGALNGAIDYADAHGAVVVAAAGNDGTVKRNYRAGVPVVIVDAVDQAGQPAQFSNAGDPRSVAAPGVGILSTAPIEPTTLFPKGTNGYAELDGTSMAAPFVSAEAALLVAQGLSPAEVRSRIESTGVATPSRGDGHGIIDAAAAVGLGTTTTTSTAAPSTSTTTATPTDTSTTRASTMPPTPAAPTSSPAPDAPRTAQITGTVTATCATAPSTYIARSGRQTVGGGTIEHALTIAHDHGPGDYQALVTFTAASPTGTVLASARGQHVPVTVTATGGSWTYSTTGAGASTVQFDLNWSCA